MGLPNLFHDNLGLYFLLHILDGELIFGDRVCGESLLDSGVGVSSRHVQVPKIKIKTLRCRQSHRRILDTRSLCGCCCRN